MRAPAWLALSLLLHVALVELLPRAGRRLPAPSLPVELIAAKPPAPAPPPMSAPAPAVASARTTKGGGARQLRQPAESPAMPALAKPAAPASARPRAGEVDLFPGDLLTARSRVTPSWGGRTRRAGD